MTVAHSKATSIVDTAPRAQKAAKETVAAALAAAPEVGQVQEIPEAPAAEQPKAAPESIPGVVVPMCHTLDDMLATAPTVLTAISRNHGFVEAHPEILADMMKAVNLILGNREAIQAVYSPVKLADLLVKFSAIVIPAKDQKDADAALLTMKSFISIVPEYVNDKLAGRARRHRWMNRALFGIGAINIGVLTYTGGRKLYDRIEQRRNEAAAITVVPAEDTTEVVAIPAPQAAA